jgi:hypothetical protein
VGHTLAAHCHVQPDVLFAIDGLDGLVHLAQLRQWQAQEGVGWPVYGVLVQVLIVSCRVQCGFDFTFGCLCLYCQVTVLVAACAAGNVALAG